MLFCGVVVWLFVSAFFVFSLVDGADDAWSGTGTDVFHHHVNKHSPDISPGTSLILARSSVLGLVAGS